MTPMTPEQTNSPAPFFSPRSQRPQNTAHVSNTNHRGEAPARDLSVDTLRGLACILLVTFHVIGDSSSAGIQVADSSVFRHYTESAESLRMPLFTFLAGLVYAWRPLADYHHYAGFMAKKARRLLIPYVVFVPVLGLTQMVAPGVNGSVEFHPVLWLFESLSPYWFLLTTFWMFAVVALADSCGLLRRPTIFGSVFLAAVTLVIFVDTSSFRALQLGQALTLFPFFLAGVGAIRFRLIPRSLPAALSWTTVLVILFVAMVFSVFGKLPPMDSRHSAVGIALGIAFPVAFLGWSLASRPIAWIGSYSSGIFLLHPFSVGFFRAVSQALGVHNDAVQFLVLSLGGVFASILGVMLLRRIRPGRVILGEKAEK